MREHGEITTVALTEKPGNAAYRGDADGSALVNFTIRHAFEDVRHHAPAIDQRLQLGGRTQISQERTHIGDIVEREQSAAKTLLGTGDWCFGFDGSTFHNVLTR